MVPPSEFVQKICLKQILDSEKIYLLRGSSGCLASCTTNIPAFESLEEIS